MAKWRIKRGEKITGELPSSKVRQLAAAGKLKKTDLLCKGGTDRWVVAGTVKGLWQTTPPSQSITAPDKTQESLQATTLSSPAATANAAVTAPTEVPNSPVKEEVPPREEPAKRVDRQETTEAPPLKEVAETIPPQEVTEEDPPQQEVVETVHHEEATEEPYEQEAVAAIHQEAVYDDEEAIEETEEDPEDEYYLEPEEETESEKPKRKWLMPLIAGGIGSLTLLGLLSLLTSRGEAPNDKQSRTPNQQSSRSQQQPPGAQYNTSSNLSLTQNFFPPNITRNFEYSTHKFENNTTVAVYRKTIIEKWNTETELYFHEKGFRNYGQKVPYRISNRYVQLKGKDNWFRFLKLDARVGDTWTPGDGEDETLDWTGKGEMKLVGFKTAGSVDVAVVEFTAKLELPVPSYLVPAAFDFGVMEDGNGPIEGKVRYELGDGLGLLRADAIVPKGTRHRTGGGRDNSEWIFATRFRNSDPKNDNTAE